MTYPVNNEFQQMYEEGQSYAEISRKTGRSVRYIKSRTVQPEVPYTTQRVLAKRAKMLEARKAGYSVAEVAKQFGTTYSYVTKYASLLVVRGKYRFEPTEADIELIRKMRKEGHSVIAISHHFGASRACIYTYLKGN